MRGDGIVRSDSASEIATRFVVLADGRSGSTLLVDELDRRWNGIRAEGEIFLPLNRTRFAHFEDVITNTYMVDTGHPIVGCKVLRDQVSRDQLDALLQLDGMRVIILRRRNELRRQVSFQIATRTAVWSDAGRQNPESTDPVRDRSISLDGRSFYRVLQATNQWFRTCEHASEGLPRINVWYEDLSADLDGELRRLGRFLGAGEPDREDPPRLRKQNPEPLRMLLTNFDEISDFLHDVGLKEFIVDEDQPKRTRKSKRRNRQLARRIEQKTFSMWGNVAMESGGKMPDPVESSSSVTTRFIVLNEGRSGSTLLVDELDRRWTEINAEREVFHPMRRDGFHHFEDVVRQTFFVDKGAPIVGCKIHGAQITAEQLSDLVKLDGMRVIILRRRNVLRRFVSERIANRTEQWEQTRGDRDADHIPLETRRITVHIPSFHARTVESSRWFTDCERISAAVPTLEVWYEDLTADLDAELRRIASFLGAGTPASEAPPLLTRQNPEPLQLLVENYDEVSAFLHDVGLGSTLIEERVSVTTPAQADPVANWQPCWPSELQQVLLRAALADADSFNAHWVEWTQQRGSQLGNEDLAPAYPALHHQLRRSHGATADLDAYRFESMRNAALKIRLLEYLENTLDTLSTVSIGSILLGPTALLAMCSERDAVGFRTLVMNGLDLTTEPEDFDSTVTSLLDLGWSAIPARGDDPAVLPFSRDGLDLRLHRTMTTASAIVSDALELDLRAGLREVNRFGPHTQMPAPAELLLSIIINGMYSRPSGTISWILDAHHLVSDDLSDRDWARFIELTSIHRLGAPVGAAIHLLGELCKDLLPPMVLKQIDTTETTNQQRRNFERAMMQS